MSDGAHGKRWCCHPNSAAATAVSTTHVARNYRYTQEGARRSVDAVLLVAERGTPHVLLIQVSARPRCRAFGRWLSVCQRHTRGLAGGRASVMPTCSTTCVTDWRFCQSSVQVHGGVFRLPGGKLRPGEEGGDSYLMRFPSPLPAAVATLHVSPAEHAWCIPCLCY